MLIALILLHGLQQPQDPAVPPPPPPPPRLAAAERLLFTLPEEFKDARLDSAFAPNGERMAVAAHLPAGRAVILTESAVSEPHDFVDTPQFSADGQHLAWVWGDRQPKEREEWELIVDGKRAKKADWLGRLVFAPVGEDYAVWSGDDVRWDEDGDRSGGEYTCNWGRKKADRFTEVPWIDPCWSADGKHLGFIGRRNRLYVVVQDGKETGPYSYAAGFTLSPDGKAAAWTGTQDYEHILIFTGKKGSGEEYEVVGAPALGPDGALAHLARVRGRAALVFRGTIVPGFFDDLGTPAVSPDGQHVVVAANSKRKADSGGWYVDNSWMDGFQNWEEDAAALFAAGSACFLVLDGRKLGGDWWRVMRPFFSPDAKHVVARARGAEGWQILLDERASPAYDEVATPHFSADGKHLAFGARRGRELLWVQIAID